MLRPTYSVTLGDLTFSSDSLGPLVSVEVSAALNGPADAAVIRVGEPPEDLPDLDADATVELGWDGEDETVFTGSVASIEQRLDCYTCVCLGASAALMRLRGDKALRNQTAGRVVTSLASEAGISLGSIDDGIDLPVYLVDSGSSYFDHCLGLARRSGVDLYTTPGGDLTFAPFSVFVPDHLLRFGADLLGLTVRNAQSPPGARVVPESPSSQAGDESSSWLSKDSESFAGSAGGEPATLVADPVLRSRDAADAAAAGAVRARARDASSGTALLMGRPALGLGAAVAFVDAPGVDGTFQVTGVRHRLDRRRGFVTSASFGAVDA